MTAHRSGARGSGAATALLAIVPLAFLVVFFLYPIATLLFEGFGVDATQFGRVVERPRFWRTMWFTVWQAATSTALTVVIGLPLAAVLARYRFVGRSLITGLVTAPFVMPTVVVASAFIATIDRFGLDDRLAGSAAVIIAAHAFFNVAVVVRTVGGYWGQLDDRPEQAARVLGASPWRAFREVTLPRLRPALLAAMSIVFLFTTTSFGVVLLLGGPGRSTLETEIYRFAVNRTDFGTASVLAIVQLTAVLGLLIVNGWLARRIVLTEGRSSIPRPPPRGRQWVAVVGVLAVVGAFLLVPLGVLVERSFRSGDGYSLANYRALGTRPTLLPIDGWSAVGNSLRYAVAAMLVAVVIGVLASLVIARDPVRSNRSERGLSWLLDVGLLLPLGTSAVTLGFGFLVALDSPVDLRSTALIIVIAQAVIGVPFVVRAVVPVLRSVDSRVREVAATLGASPRAVRREIDLPLARRAVVIGAVFSFAVALGEFGATSFVGRAPDRLTVPLAIARLLGQPGQALRGQAMALSTVLMVMTVTIVMLVDRRDRSAVL